MFTKKQNRDSKVFRRTLWGYRTLEVDSRIEELLNRNEKLQQELSQLNELLNDYRQKEESIYSAIIKAEKTALETNSHAVQEAERLIGDAGKETAKIINSAQEKAGRLAKEIEGLKLNIQKAGRDSLEKFLHLTRFHFDSLENEFLREINSNFQGIQKELAIIHQVKPGYNTGDTVNSPTLAQNATDNILLGRTIRKDILDEAGNLIYPRETIVTPEVIASLVTKGFYGELIESLDLH